MNRYRMGFSQPIRIEWMDHVVNLMIAGEKEKEIRANLKDFLAKQDNLVLVGCDFINIGKIRKNPNTKAPYCKAISNLTSWFAPDESLIPFRDQALELIKKENPENWLPYHWAVMSASYPLWFQVSKVIGKLVVPYKKEIFSQYEITKQLEQHYGKRTTLERNIHNVLNSFLLWGFIKVFFDCYTTCDLKEINNIDITMLLYESALYADTEDGKTAISKIWNNFAFFPFKLPALSIKYISQHSKNIKIHSSGCCTQLLALKT